MRLIVGLGNPGKQYILTRHNAGFMFIEYFSQILNIKVNKIKFKSLVGEAFVDGEKIVLLKPQTFMNLSGEAVMEAVRYYNVNPEDIITVYDDVSLDLGVLRIRRKGSDGGHNGIKSIIGMIGTDEFPRIRLGIGSPPNPDWDLADWVLGEIASGPDRDVMFEMIKRAGEAAKLMIKGEIDGAMNLYNGGGQI